MYLKRAWMKKLQDCAGKIKVALGGKIICILAWYKVKGSTFLLTLCTY